jgi:hypothetical protein
MKVGIESGATDWFEGYAQPSPAPTGHPMVAQGKGGTSAALGWTVFQGTEAL